MLRLLTSIIFISTNLLMNAQSSIDIEKLVVFTDGNSYVTKEGIIEVKDKFYILKDDQLPIPRYGTFYVNDTGKSLKYVSSAPEVDIANSQPKSILSVLSMNKGKMVELETHEEVIRGSISDVFHGYIVIKTNHELIVKIDNIRSFRFLEALNIDSGDHSSSISREYDIYGREVKKEKIKSKLKLHFDSDGRKEIHMSYMQKGISWNPNYRLNLKNKDKASLSLQAEIINDIEGFEQAEIELVVGEPNFHYHEYLTDLIDYSNILDPYYEKRSGSNGLYNSSISLYEVGIILKDDKHTKFHDFQIHRLENVSLEKNSRALFRIYEEEVPYKHIYECELQSIDFSKSYNNNRTKEEPNKVYHCIQIENTTNALLSKGSVFIFEGEDEESRPIAQSNMAFIPVMGQGSIKLTENNEIEVNRNERIVKRQEEEVEFWGREYYKAYIGGTIKIVNYNKQKVELFIDSEIIGEINGKNPKMEIISQKQPFHSPNYLSKVRWKVSLDAGETKEINYDYQVFVD